MLTRKLSFGTDRFFSSKFGNFQTQNSIYKAKDLIFSKQFNNSFRISEKAKVYFFFFFKSAAENKIHIHTLDCRN